MTKQRFLSECMKVFSSHLHLKKLTKTDVFIDDTEGFYLSTVKEVLKIGEWNFQMAISYEDESRLKIEVFFQPISVSDAVFRFINEFNKNINLPLKSFLNDSEEITVTEMVIVREEREIGESIRCFFDWLYDKQTTKYLRRIWFASND